jgi:hypothetical protein
MIIVKTEECQQIAIAVTNNERLINSAMKDFNGLKPNANAQLNIKASKIKVLIPIDSFQKRKSKINVPTMSKMNKILVCFSIKLNLKNFVFQSINVKKN